MAAKRMDGSRRTIIRTAAGGAAAPPVPRRSIGQNDPTTGRIPGHAERALQLRHVHAVRGAKIMQGGRRRCLQRWLVQGLRARGLERFRAKWIPVRVKKTRQDKS